MQLGKFCAQLTLSVSEARARCAAALSHEWFGWPCVMRGIPAGVQGEGGWGEGVRVDEAALIFCFLHGPRALPFSRYFYLV
jgi:hypothetical protein